VSSINPLILVAKGLLCLSINTAEFWQNFNINPVLFELLNFVWMMIALKTAFLSIFIRYNFDLILLIEIKIKSPI
jgi:hypothetical protein